VVVTPHGEVAEAASLEEEAEASGRELKVES
jgi:hypothetical protein